MGFDKLATPFARGLGTCVTEVVMSRASQLIAAVVTGAISLAATATRAAERLRVAQPSLSQQIQKLEAEVGQPLFERLPRGILLTGAGRNLLPFARRILIELADAQRAVDECHQEPAGSVCVGFIPTMAPYLAGPLFAAVADACPKLALYACEDVTEALVRRLDDGELDLAIVSTCRNGAGLLRETWTREPLLVALPQGHPLAQADGLSWRDLRKETFLVLHEAHCLSRQIGRWCEQHGLRVRATLSALQLSTVLALVAAGEGLSLVPSMAVPHEQGRGCAFVRLEEPGPEREINAIRNPARLPSKAVEAFVKVARRVACEANAGSDVLKNFV